MSKEALKMDSILGFPYRRLLNESQIYLNSVILYTNHFTKQDKMYNSHSVSMVAKYKLLCDLIDRPYHEKIIQYYKAI